jgi:glycosyltransferase involved in cell wall biosynthesis
VIAMLTAPTSTEDGARDPATGPLIDVVVPVYNEQESLGPSIRRLHRFLDDQLPFAWRIVIADNASTDATPAIAATLALELPHIEVVRLAAKGRGRALRAAWSRSDADVRCYMDVDLSTDLRALLPLIAGLVSGHSDVAIGTRLAAGSRVVRGPKRELISRSYNRLLRIVLRARFSDAQCGFKAISAHAARTLLPQVRDDAWFFDTELLVLAQRRGLRIHEVAVDWVDDPASSVEIVSTAIADLRGVARLALQSRFARFALVGVASTLVYAALYLLLRSALAPVWANGIALAVTAVANTQANRLVTFGLRGTDGLLAQHVAGLAAFALALALTDGALAALTALDPGASRALETSVLVVASAAGTVGRYLALRLVLSRGAAAALRRPSSLRFARRAARDQRRSRRYERGRPASPAQPCPEPPGQP